MTIAKRPFPLATTAVISALFVAFPSATIAEPSFFKEGFQIDAAARQFCQIDADFDAMFGSIAVGQRGFEEVDAPDGEMAYEHPDGIALNWMPAMVTTPGAATCMMTVSSDLMTEEMFNDYVGAATQSVPNYDLGAPTVTDAGQVWEFQSNKDSFSGKVWATRLTRSESGALIFEKWPQPQ